MPHPDDDQRAIAPERRRPANLRSARNARLRLFIRTDGGPADNTKHSGTYSCTRPGTGGHWPAVRRYGLCGRLRLAGIPRAKSLRIRRGHLRKWEQNRHHGLTSKIAPHKQRNNRRRAKKHSCGYPLPVYNSKSLVWKGHHESENWIFNRQTEAAVLELTRISVYFDTRCYNDDLL